MKILLSSYACEPNIGSEPGAGWHWGLYLAQLGHEVTVLTRSNNQGPVEGGMQEFPELTNLRFEYYDTPYLLRFWKKMPMGIYLYYALWQIGAFFKAKALNREHPFDCVQHVTFASLRQPSFMGFLGIPFYFGPVGGGERAPMALRRGYPLIGWWVDMIRDFLNAMVWLDPLMHLTFASAERIYATSDESLKAVPGPYRGKTHIALQMGIEPALAAPESDRDEPVQQGEFRMLFAGRLLYWKGIHLGLRAVAKLVAHVPDGQKTSIRYTVIGSGPQEGWLKSQARELGIDANVEWVPYIKQPELWKKFTEFDVFLFPSLHDSGGVVVLETMSNGLPVVCLNIGGPGVVVNETCGRNIQTAGRSEEDVVDSLYHGLLEIWENPELRVALREGARQRAREFDWKLTVSRVHTEQQ